MMRHNEQSRRLRMSAAAGLSILLGCAEGDREADTATGSGTMAATTTATSGLGSDGTIPPTSSVATSELSSSTEPTEHTGSGSTAAEQSTSDTGDEDLCGNMKIEGAEECDDGNAIDGDACTNSCTLVVCGDGIAGLAEECDDGNEDDLDGCTNACKLPKCGDGVPAGDEECDDGNAIDSDGCTNACTFAVCGDGVIDPGEDCDDVGESALCDADCTLVTCGDGQFNALAGEYCDDGNVWGEDSCSPLCLPIPVQIASGRTHVCALNPDGNVNCWGSGEVGQLGYGDIKNLGDQPGELPTAPVIVGGKAAKISLGYRHSCALLVGHRLRCWGGSDHGELGQGTTNNLGDNPGELPVPDIAVGADVLQVAAGNDHTCVLVPGGKVRCWGGNDFGQLGYGDLAKLIAPNGADVPGLVDVVQIAAGATHTCVLQKDGAVRCWGDNEYGQLGLGHNQILTAPGPAAPVGDPDDPVVSLSAGYVHNCAVLASGKVRCWGWNMDGQGGARFGDSRIGDTPGEMPPPNVDLGGPAVQATGGYTHSCALMKMRTVKCWGANVFHGYPGLGPIDTAQEFPPPNVDVGGEVAGLSGHLGSFTCAHLTNQTVRCWGDNTWGQLGVGHTNSIGDNETPASVGPVPL